MILQQITYGIKVFERMWDNFAILKVHAKNFGPINLLGRTHTGDTPLHK